MNNERTTSKVQELTYELKIKDVMINNIKTVNSAMSICSLGDFLKENRITGVPVVDEDDLVGLISIEDYINCVKNQDRNAIIKNKMTTKVETLYADEPLIHAVTKFDKFILPTAFEP